jgi:hypothetical protein
MLTKDFCSSCTKLSRLPKYNLAISNLVSKRAVCTQQHNPDFNEAICLVQIAHRISFINYLLRKIKNRKYATFLPTAQNIISDQREYSEVFWKSELRRVDDINGTLEHKKFSKEELTKSKIYCGEDDLEDLMEIIEILLSQKSMKRKMRLALQAITLNNNYHEYRFEFPKADNESGPLLSVLTFSEGFKNYTQVDLRLLLQITGRLAYILLRIFYLVELKIFKGLGLIVKYYVISRVEEGVIIAYTLGPVEFDLTQYDLNLRLPQTRNTLRLFRQIFNFTNSLWLIDETTDYLLDQHLQNLALSFNKNKDYFTAMVKQFVIGKSDICHRSVGMDVLEEKSIEEIEELMIALDYGLYSILYR